MSLLLILLKWLGLSAVFILGYIVGHSFGWDACRYHMSPWGKDEKEDDE